MSDQKLPPGWDEARIREVIEHYDSQDEDERAAEDRGGLGGRGDDADVGAYRTGPGDPRAARPQADRLTWRCSGPSHAGGSCGCARGTLLIPVGECAV